MENIENVRQSVSLTWNLEQRFIKYLVQKTPLAFKSDFFTALAFLGTLLTFLGFFFSKYSPYYLVLAPIGFILHWYGDSLDGALARFRHETSPRFGYFVDHISDSLSVIIIALGMGLSNYFSLYITFFFMLVYLLYFQMYYVICYLQNIANISVGKVGPTEIRLIGIVLAVIMFFDTHPQRILFNQFTYYDIVLFTLCAIMGFLFLIESLTKAIELKKIDRQDKKPEK